MAGLAILNIALADDLQRLLREKVENGRFPNEQAVVERASRSFLIEQPEKGQAPLGPATEPEKEDEEGARPWCGVHTLEFPEEVLFTKSMDLRPEQLGEWRPRRVTSERQVPDDKP